MERRWKVLALVSVGVFMVSLDLFIVNIAFPQIEGDFDGSSVSADLVGAERVRDRHRRADGLRRPVGRPARAQARCSWRAALFVLGSALCGAAPRSRRWSPRA